MKKITAPLGPGDQGDVIVNLQDGLRRLITARRIELDDGERDEFLLALAKDSQRRVYEGATLQTVERFQSQRGLEPSGKVDEATADHLNAELEEIGGFTSDDGGWQEVVAAINGQTETLRRINDGTDQIAKIDATVRDLGQRVRIARGQVRRTDTQPAPGRTIAAIHEAGQEAIRLGQDVTDREGRYTIRYDAVPGVNAINLRVLLLADDGRTLATSRLVQNAGAAETLDLVAPLAGAEVSKRSFVGRVTLQDGREAEGVTLRLVRRTFGGGATDLDETTTQFGGRYALSFTLDPAAASLQILAIRTTGETVPLEAQLNYLGNEAAITRDLVAPSDMIPRPIEFQRLATDLQPHIGEIAALAGAKETTDRQDLTVLNRATRWDARLLAQGALAARLSADEQTPTSVEGFYGLLRAGLPTDKTLLAQVDSAVVAETLTAVRDIGIIGLDNGQIDTFTKDFQTFSTNVRLALPVPGGNTSYAALLDASGLSDAARERFAGVYANHGGDAAKLWAEARTAGVGEPDIARLQLQGKLAFLTSNSQGMTAHLLGLQVNNGAGGAAVALTDPADLADLGLYTQEAWDQQLTKAGMTDQNVDSFIPSAYPGKLEQRRKDFSADMARKMRVSYPMHALAHQIRNDPADDFQLGAASAPLAKVLRNAGGQGFRLGSTPIDGFVESHPGVFEGMTAADQKLALTSAKDLQRTYQICPDDATMKAMRKHGLHSAYDVLGMGKPHFFDYYGHIFTNPKVAALVYRKAEQVSSVVYNLFTVANQIESQVVVYGASAPADVRQAVKNDLIKHYPTMESLFGSMDFCECEHCRSVLSPAAYLVDLLQYVEGEDTARAGFAARWKDQHKSKDHPNGEEYSARYALPYDVLIKRRPDLIHIPLTCENTHTALPYIDIVNEILEYYVAHNGTLAAEAAHDTGEATTAELLAEPQHVLREAYETVRTARYPLTLPFDLWLETVRQFCDYFETPLPELLETFRAGDELLVPTQPYDRATIFIESLGLSPDEAALFTDPNPLVGGKWYTLFGYATTGLAIGTPTNAAPDATFTLPNTQPFAVNNPVTYYDVSANGVQGEVRTIKALGAVDSGGAGQRLVTIEGVWTTSPVAGDQLIAAAPALLASAKTLARRLDVTYKEIVEIVKTGFVNPKLVALTLLYKLGVTVQDIFFYRDHLPFHQANSDLLGKLRDELNAANQARYDTLGEVDAATGLTGWDIVKRVQALLDRLAAASIEFAPFAARTWLDAALAANAFNDVLVLADPNAGCDFDATTLRYADGRSAADIDFLRINLFVRLWRKLGWTIAETDRALTIFTEKTPFTVANLSKQPLRPALFYLTHLKRLNEQVKVGKGSRLMLLTLWADLATTGKSSPYAQRFLTRSALKSGTFEIVLDNGAIREVSIFDSPLGRYLEPSDLQAIAQRVRYRVSVAGIKPADQIDPAAFDAEPTVSVEYDPLGEVQTFTYRGLLTNAVKAQLALLSNAPSLPTLLDAVQLKGAEFTLIKGHLPALQGALGLTADEMRHILSDGSPDKDNAALTLSNVSLLYRYGLLAKALKLSVSELIALKALSGLNPFTALHAMPPATLAEDHPFSQTLRFVEIAEEVRSSGLSVEDLDYLLRHHFDPVGPYRPKPEEHLLLFKTLAEGIRTIRAQHAVPGDVSAITTEFLQTELGLLLPADVVQRFLGMADGSAEFVATQTGVAAGDALDPAAFGAAPAIVAVSLHKAARGEQKLTYRGVLFAAEQTALETQFNALPAAKLATLRALLTNVRQQARDFFDNQLKKQPLRRPDETGYLEEIDFAGLFELLKPLKLILPTDTEAQAEAKRLENEAITEENRLELEGRRVRIANVFLPALQARLIRQFVMQTVTASIGADPALVESLLTDERLLGLPAAAPTNALLTALTAVAEAGIDAQFFNNDDLTGVPQATRPIVASADTALKDAQDTDGNALGLADSARFSGYLEVPAAGAYRFYIVLETSGSACELRFEHLAEPVFLSGTAAGNGAVFGTGATEFLELKPGLPYRFTFEATQLNGGAARLLVQGEALPKGPLAQLNLYSAQAIDAATQALLRLGKALQLLQTMALSERETRYLLIKSADFGGVNLSALPTAPVDATDAAAVVAMRVRFGWFLRLAAYARLKRDLAGGTDDLIAIFEANATTGADKLDTLMYPLIARLTRRDATVVKSVANALFAAPAFASEQPLQRLWAALQVVERFGVSVASLLGWTDIVNPRATPTMRFAIARDIREGIKARFEPEAWKRVAQPIFDKLRQRQRDALVAHVLHTRGFERLEQLYEYFLIDPGMEPVVQTSRIRLAIGSVQLFIQRCLLNLEADVHPSAILNPEHWEWMKRYRVWEANRKIFLFPENWLEPEFRDDKTHLFTELEGALLQGDVSRDLVEDAFLNYLRKLDELARLDICAMHLEQKDDPGQNVLHVFGRTYATPHKYFYRRYAASMWTPWEPVTAEISGDHLAPVIWRDRLYLFWITFIEKANPPATAEVKIDYKSELKFATTPTTYLEAYLHWSEYFNGAWSTYESSGTDAADAMRIDGVSLANIRDILIHVSKKYDEPAEPGDSTMQGEELGVFIHLNVPGKTDLKSAFYLAGRNSRPIVDLPGALPTNPYPSASTARANRYAGNGSLTVNVTRQISTEQGKPPAAVGGAAPMLASVAGEYTLLPLNHALRSFGVPKSAYEEAAKPDEVKKALERSLAETESLLRPVFFQDAQHTFFVEPDVVERTIEDWQTWLEPAKPSGPVVVVKPPKLREFVEVYIPKWQGEPWPPEDPLVWNKKDLVTNPITFVKFDDVAIGPHGKVQVAFEQGAAEALLGSSQVLVNPASAVHAGETVLLRDNLVLNDVGLQATAGGVNLLGAGGINEGMLENFNQYGKR
jgi:hypothetical protein